MLAKVLKGTASSGAWLVLDDFHQITLEVLSVVAQHVLAIQRAKSSHAKALTMDGTHLALSRRAAVTIALADRGYDSVIYIHTYTPT